MRILKSTCAILLLLAMVIPMTVFSASAKEITITADGINATRESGTLIIYNPDKGANTETNEWGFEVVIENNVAVKYNQFNSAIPANGFVISGHNQDQQSGGKRMGDWIKENIKIGDYVYYTPEGKITVSDKPLAINAYYTVSKNVTGFDTVRGTDALVIYTKAGTETGTNDWGIEVVCTNGTVTAIGGNNNKVPTERNSCVVSGHGASVTWLRENVKLGMSVKYDIAKKTVSFSYDSSAVIGGMDLNIKTLWDLYDTAIKRYDNFNYASAKAAIEELENDIATAKGDYLKDKDDNKLISARDSVEKRVLEIRLMICESRTAEYRGVWIRPTDTSAKQVEETVQALYERGINMISIETIYDCTMIMPMPKDCLFETNPKFARFDMLQAYIDACHKRGMELHLWMPIFYVGNVESSNIRRSVGNKKPEWLSLSSNGKTFEDTEGYCMIDPSNEEACNYLLNTYKYILENYDVDGFQLDYIRFFTRTATFDMGYNEGLLDAFEAEYGVRPKYDTNAKYWNDWVNFRCTYVDSFVQKMRKLIDDVAPGVLLGADVVPDPTESVTYNYQNYYTWLENKWIDILFPMSYGHGYNDAIIAQTKRCGDSAYIAVGLGTFMVELGADTMQEQASFNTSVYTDGSVYFEATAYTKKGVGELLANGVYRNKAIAPAFDIKLTGQTQLNYMKERITNILIPLGGISEDGAKTVATAIDTLYATLTDSDFGIDEYKALVDAVKASDADDTAKSRMLSDAAIAIKGYTVKNKSIDTSDVPEIPDNPDFSDNSDVDNDKSDVANEDEDNSAVTSESDSDKDTKKKVWPIVLGVAGAVAAAGVAAFFILKKKKK